MRLLSRQPVVLMILALVAASGCSTLSPKWRYGALGGLNMADIGFSPALPYEHEWRTGLRAGGFISRNVCDCFWLDLEALYGTDGSLVRFPDADVTYGHKNLSFGSMLSYDPWPKSDGPEFFGGPQMNFKLGDRISQNGDVVPDADRLVRAFDPRVVVGSRYLFDRRHSIDFRFGWGLKDILRREEVGSGLTGNSKSLEILFRVSWPKREEIR